MKYCMRCGTQLTDGTAFCMNCGTPVASNAYGNSQPYRQPQYQHNAYRQPQYNQVPPNRQQPYGYRDPFQTAPVDYAGPQYYQQPRQNVGLLDWLTGKVNQFAGGQGAVRPPLHHLFSETFQKHTQEEAEEIFACGSPKTTPRLSSGDTLWPKPWLYARILVALAAAYLMLYICCTNFQNIKALPGALVLGSFMVPASVMVFFFELNTPKNVSFYTVLKVFLVGGCASLLLTLIFYEIIPVGEMDYTGAILVSIIEELGKLGIVAWFLSKEKNAKYHINGLLIGAAVGAGFAAFESAGYALESFIVGGYEGMMDNIFLRGVLAPGGHVVWAAMSGYAIMVVKKFTGPNPMGFLSQSRFWAIFWMPVAMHAVWDMPITIGAEIYLSQVLMVVMSWIVIFVLIANSLAQLGRLLRNETHIHIA